MLEPHFRSYGSANFSRLVILDRDETIIEDLGYTHKIHELNFLPGALEAIQLANSLHAKVAIATNQSGVGRQYFSLHEMETFHNFMVKEILRLTGVEVSAIASCTHAPEDGCGCRKPKPGLIDLICSNLEASKSETIFFGNSITDLQAGKDAGVETYMARGEELIPLLERWSNNLDRN
jgi:D-glycero-D-manno-heptose 1,7-bisphosphate phosphatase